MGLHIRPRQHMYICLCTGARLKVMRCAGAGPVVPFSFVGRRAFDAGVGVNLDLNGAGISPVVRLHLHSCPQSHKRVLAAVFSDCAHAVF